jgi:hypothetical protein
MRTVRRGLKLRLPCGRLPGLNEAAVTPEAVVPAVFEVIVGRQVVPQVEGRRTTRQVIARH